MVEFAYNNSVHGSSGFTPFYLCYGRHPVSPVNLLSQVESKNESCRFVSKTVGGGCGSGNSELKKGAGEAKRLRR